jgi:hypothetical protein
MIDHEWREQTEEGTRIYRARRFARRWTLQSRLKSEDEWTEVPPPFDPVLVEKLRDLLWAKYQRRRVPFEVVCEIDRLLPEGVRLTDRT